MSVEINRPELPKTKKDRKSDGEKGKKKRKRKTNENIEAASPTNKKRFKPQDRSLQPTETQIPGPVPSAETSPFYEHCCSLYLPIAPIAQQQPVQALCAEHLSPLILSYYQPFHGVIISYSNPRCHSSPDDISSADGRQKVFARSIDEYAASFVWLTAKFLLFKPKRGDVIEGFINLQNENNIGIVYWNFFNASIERSRLPKDWAWVPGRMSARRRGEKLKKAAKGAESPDEDDNDDDEEEVEEVGRPEVADEEGHFKDGNEKKVEGLIRFWVRHVETSRSVDRENGFLSVEGTMLSPEDGKRGNISYGLGRALTNGPLFSDGRG